MKKILQFLFLTAFLFFLMACATKKKSRSDISWLKRNYHNMTAKYNGYFNANVLYTEGLAKLNSQHQDNYTKILDLYPYTAVEDPKSVAADLDKAIEKLSVDIALHRVSDWVDDCYLLIGKSQYLKQDFESAETTLEYLVEEYNPEKPKSLEDRRKAAEENKKEKAKIKEEEKKIREKEKEETKKAKEKEKKIEKKEKAKTTKEKAKERERLKNQKEKERKDKAKARERERKEKEKQRKTGAKTTKNQPQNEIKKDSIAENELTAQQKMQQEVRSKKKDKKEIGALPTDANGNFDPTKSAIKPKRYFLQRRPCFQEAQLWLARTYVERKRYEESAAILRQLEMSPRTFYDIRDKLAEVKAYFYLQQKNYEKALDPLQRAIEGSKNRKEKARMTYILAQIQDLLGQEQAALASYQKVLKYSTHYEMEFNARLNIAQRGWQHGTQSAQDAIASLKKMAKDIKNEEYKDQIYYAIANIALKNKDKNGAIENLKLSLRNNSKSKTQKAESYLQLAELYYEDEAYINAKNYYDSTLTVISKTDERYDKITNYANSLTDIAKHLETITFQDSLLKISTMSIAEKKDLLKKIKKAEKEKAEAEAVASKNIGNNDNNNNNSGGIATIAPGKSSDFFAYNDKTLRRGKKDFEQRWGKRKLDDNWRRSNRKGANNDIADENKNTTTDANQDVSDKELTNYFKEVPTSPDQTAAANAKIEEAMFSLGTLYRDRIKRSDKTTHVLENMTQRFPNSKHELDAWYYLYLAYSDLKNEDKTKFYYDKIVSKYPTATYARALQDPNFLKTSKKEEQQVTEYYDTAYKTFQNKQYKEALEMLSQADKKFKKNPIPARFALLSALCIGNVQGKDPYIAALKEVIAKFPNSAEEKRAKEIIRLLGADATLVAANNNAGNADANPAEENGFIAEHDKIHYAIIILEKDEDLNDAKIAVADYNREYFKNDNLKMSNLYLDSESKKPIIVLRRFDNKDMAMKYLEKVNNNRKGYIPTKIKYELFPVTQNNYRKIIGTGSVDSYREFFAKNYFN